MMDRRIRIDGMGCEGCVSTVESALKEVAGVERVDVSLEAGEARVEAADDVTVEDLVAAVVEAGYDAAPGS